MASSGQPFRLKGLLSDKVSVKKNNDTDQWRKRVLKASEFAVSEVFSHKKTHSGNSRLAAPLQSLDQFTDHDDAYSEAQALLGDWLGTKLRLELEMDDADDPRNTAENTQPAAFAHNYSNFDDLYARLAEEEEQSVVNSFLQNLTEQELLDSRMVKELSLNDGEIRKKFINPVVTMEARHQQVRENRLRRDAERKKRLMEKEARKEAKRREWEEEMKKKQEECREEKMVQKEMMKLRRQMEERRGLERRVRQKEREQEVQKEVRSAQPIPIPPTKQKHLKESHQQLEQNIQTLIHMSKLKCLHRHFSGWHSVVLDKKLCMDKVVALCNWRRRLKAWQAWRSLVWAAHRQREVARTEEALRKENRQTQLAAESDRRRLLRRCLGEWQLWCRTEKARRELFARQQETKEKMAAVSVGKLTVAENSADPLKTAPLEEMGHHMSDTYAPDPLAVHQDKPSSGTDFLPSQPWQVTRRHVAPTAAELLEARRIAESDVLASKTRTVSSAGRFENRHAVQQQIIMQQRKLLKEQQEQITRLKEKQSMMGLELEIEKTSQLTQLSVLRGSRPMSCSVDPKEQRAPTAPAEPDSQKEPSRKAVSRQTCPHPIITAMEARARRRAEQRKEIEELKRKKEETKLAEMKAAEEQRQREEEEEKRQAAERKREEKRLERQREEEKQRQRERHQELMRLAHQHYSTTLLSRRGLVPWKRLIQLKQASVELAENHHRLNVLKRCILGWQQHTRESVSEKEARADRFYQHFLLQRSLNCWKRMRDMRRIQEQQADHFYRKHTLRRVLLGLLDHVTQERLVELDSQNLAQEHNDRRILLKTLQAWRQLPSVLRSERRRDKRREKLSRKVAEVLPDFCSRPT
ncbi:coiled-coil domain-containing protein 191 [Nothobranchius furzeri]|uniref:Coiled-coil domain containing 191 n=2 Tax=Nothobranchius furzeri TaxID=105023 RepID=A0A9D3BL04_NOTFU|nr:coiled-coil domain containing 191 [Nothobranchius furzeri]